MVHKALAWASSICRNALKDYKEAKLCFVIIFNLCVWIQRFLLKTLQIVILHNRESNVLTRWCFPRGLTSLCCMKDSPDSSVMLTSGLFSRNGEQFVSIFFFYRRQSSTMNNSVVIKQFIGQWAYANDIFPLNTSESVSRFYLSHNRMFERFIVDCCSSDTLRGFISGSRYSPLHKLYFRYQRQGWHRWGLNDLVIYLVQDITNAEWCFVLIKKKVFGLYCVSAAGRTRNVFQLASRSRQPPRSTDKGICRESKPPKIPIFFIIQNKKTLLHHAVKTCQRAVNKCFGWHNFKSCYIGGGHWVIALAFSFECSENTRNTSENWKDLLAIDCTRCNRGRFNAFMSKLGQY